MDVIKVMELNVQCDEPLEIGETPKGFLRVIPIVGGTFQGTSIQGTIIPGGADWNTLLKDGTTEVWARYTMETNDGTLISITNEGVHGNGKDEPIWTRPSFLAPVGPYAWLNEVTLIGMLEPQPLDEGIAVTIHLFRLKDN